MKLEIEIRIVEKYSTISSSELSIEAATLPDADITALIAQLVASAKAEAAAKNAQTELNLQP